MSDDNCADCGGFDIEWMYSCKEHKGVKYCRGCSCPLCDEEEAREYDADRSCYYCGEESCDCDLL